MFDCVVISELLVGLVLVIYRKFCFCGHGTHNKQNLDKWYTIQANENIPGL
jgi:hypothetical protein